MKNLVIADESVLVFWESYVGPELAPALEDPLPESAASNADLHRLGVLPQAGCSGTVHLMVGANVPRKRTRRIVTHQAPAVLPNGAFRKVGPGVYVVSPELLYVQRASRLPVAQALVMANKFCGCYALRGGDVPYRAPIATVSSLKRLANECFSQGSESTAPRALRWAVDGARSPVEAQVAALLSLPARYGGWAIDPPRMNAWIDLSAQAQKQLGVPYCSVDFF